jgi:uncharacterized protein YceK
MRKLILSLPILFAFMLVLSGCGSKVVEPTAKENLTKTWNVNIAKHDNVEVYKKGAASNQTPGYSAVTLSLTASTASFVAIDGNVFSGTWDLSTDNKTLTLSGMKNIQGVFYTGTTGTIVFTITSPITATAITIDRQDTDTKVGGKKVNLQLVNP